MALSPGPQELWPACPSINSRTTLGECIALTITPLKRWSACTICSCWSDAGRMILRSKMLVAPLAIGHEGRRDQNEKYYKRGLGFCRRGGYHGMVSIIRFVSPCYLAPSALWNNFDGFASSHAGCRLPHFSAETRLTRSIYPSPVSSSRLKVGVVSRQRAARANFFLCRFSYFVVRVDLAVCLDLSKL